MGELKLPSRHSSPPSPGVSVLLPVRFPAPWLGEALESLSAQSQRPNEVLVLVHGSGSESLGELLHPGRLEVRVIPKPSSLSFPELLNEGISHCRYELVARLDADDVCAPTRLERQVRAFNSQPQAVLCASEAWRFSSPTCTHTRLVRSIRWASPRRRLLWRNDLAHSSIMFKRSAALSVGGYSSEAQLAEDYDLWLRLAGLGPVLRIEEPLVGLRTHDDQATRRAAPPMATWRRLIASRSLYASSANLTQTEALLASTAWGLRQAVRSFARAARPGRPL